MVNWDLIEICKKCVDENKVKTVFLQYLSQSPFINYQLNIIFFCETENNIYQVIIIEL